MSSRHIVPTLRTWDPWSPNLGLEPLPPGLERRIAERWKRWVPWVSLYLSGACQSGAAVDPAMNSADFCRFRQRHSEHILNLMRASFSMRTIRRHRLDDPRLNDEAWRVLVAAAKERQSKARYQRSEEQRTLDRLTTHSEPREGHVPPASVVLDPLAVPGAIQAIRQHVCEHFYLREMCDPELRVRTNRRAYVFPRQIAMYIARQLTGASLQQIGREFGGRHHTTVLHAINKIDEMRRSEKALDRTIVRLEDTLPLILVS